MKRRALKFFVFLLAGAIINVAVASALSDRKFIQGEWTTVGPKEVMWWKRTAPPGFMDVPSAMFHQRVVGATFDLIVHARDIGQSLFIDEHAWRSRLGWPMRSLEHSLWRDAMLVHHQRDVMKLPIDWPRIDIPARPLWTGFAINTIFYAAILWFSAAAPRVLRRKRRLRRGQCAACGYSLRENVSDKCPECGCSTPSPALFGNRERAGVRAR